MNVTVSTVESKSGEPASARPCPGGCKDFLTGSFARFIRMTCKICGTVRIDTLIKGEAMHTRGKHVGLIVALTLILFRVRSTMLSRQYEQNLRIVMKRLQIVYSKTRRSRQLDLATRLMLEHVSRLSNGDYEQSLMVQYFLDCVDRATEPSSAFVSFREQPVHFNDNQTLNLPVVDPIADDGVWAVVVDGCNSYKMQKQR